MKRMCAELIPYVLIMIMAFFSSCSDSEHRLAGISSNNNTATVVINLGLPDGLAFDNPSMIDRILRFFSRDAVAQSATPPVAIASYMVSVTGPTMEPINRVFNSNETITLTVPAGTTRTFAVTATVSPSSPSAIASFRGSATRDLTAGETINLPITMGLYETKLIIPDMQNLRIVQINGLSNDGWRTKMYDTFYPTDVDFDATGNFYVVDQRTTSGIFKFSSISDTIDFSTPTISTPNYPYAIGIDRTRNIIYFSTGTTYGNPNALYRSTFNGVSWSNSLITITGIPSVAAIRGIDVEQTSGDLFLACVYGSPTVMPAVVRINSSGVYIAHQNLGGLNYISSDVIIKQPYVYVAQYYTVSGSDSANRIIQFDINLRLTYSAAPFLHQYGTNYFIGPCRFVATLNRRFFVIDELANYMTERMVGFDGIDGSGWTQYGQRGFSSDGPGYFNFYSYC